MFVIYMYVYSIYICMCIDVSLLTFNFDLQFLVNLFFIFFLAVSIFLCAVLRRLFGFYLTIL